MFKITAILSILLLGNLLVAGLSCDSCGSECAAACGTRHFRSCCFNYLRRKRDPDTFKFPTHRVQDMKIGRYHKEYQPEVMVEDVPEWMGNPPSGFKSYYIDDKERVDSTYDL